ncbi:head-tail connector protein [Bosea sp. LjRoot90]|uniref:head-tail connector protein n=1 Tax=Bosea sp. LjRoot90 TaxID=3342342 RepID=UPI003ECCB029
MHCLPPELVTAPTAKPVTVAEAKAHLRVDHDLDDALIERAIDAAISHLDGYGGILGRALMAQRWRQFFSFWPASRCLPLSLAPAAAIVEVRVRAPDGSESVVDPAGYRLLAAASRPQVLFPVSASLPALDSAPDAIAVTYGAGYGETADKVPAPIRQAMLLMVGDMYRFPETVVLGSSSAPPMSASVDRLLGPYRRNLVA